MRDLVKAAEELEILEDYQVLKMPQMSNEGSLPLVPHLNVDIVVAIAGV